MRARKSREEWAAVIAEFEGSVEPLERFCRRRCLAPATLRWGRWRLTDSAAAAAPAGDLRVIAVDVLAQVAPGATPSSLRVVGAFLHPRVGIHGGADPTHVGAPVAARCRQST